APSIRRRVGYREGSTSLFKSLMLGCTAPTLLYTSNRGGTISVDRNGQVVTGPLTITSTFNASDPIAWRQWHHWNNMPAIMKLRLPAGKSVLTVHILTGGNMNLAYFDFKEAH
ncbi:MAG TPA: hypothetical protein VK593_02920, partial [Edaphobacter sp.]|nr:hypothetical protein [Edaphobacter sp.]